MPRSLDRWRVLLVGRSRALMTSHRRTLLVALAVALVGILAVVAAFNGSEPEEENASAKRIVAEVEKQAGPSKSPTGAFISSLPYNASVPAGTKQVYVGGTMVYENFMPGSSLLARPTESGHEAFVYLAGPEAPTSFTFSFHLLPDTQLEKQTNGSVRVMDATSKVRAPLVQEIRALNTTDGRLHPASASVEGNTIRLDFNLKSPRYPVMAQFEYVDPTPALVEGRVPAVKEAKATIEVDGPARPLQKDDGVYYASIDGLVIKLAGPGTIRAVNYAANVDKGEELDPVVRAVLAGTNAEVTEVLRQAEVPVEDELVEPLTSADLKDKCLTVTVPVGGLSEFTDRYALVWAGEQTKAAEVQQPESMSLEMAQCEGAAPKPEPEPKPRPVTKPRPLPVAPLNPPAWTVPPTTVSLDMNQLCRQRFGSGATAVSTNPNNRDSWACDNSAGSRLGAIGQEDMGIYCQYILPGSVLTPVGNTPADWRCKLG